LVLSYWRYFKIILRNPLYLPSESLVREFSIKLRQPLGSHNQSSLVAPLILFFKELVAHSLKLRSALPLFPNPAPVLYLYTSASFTRRCLGLGSGSKSKIGQACVFPFVNSPQFSGFTFETWKIRIRVVPVTVWIYLLGRGREAVYMCVWRRLWYSIVLQIGGTVLLCSILERP
jgi:hypothetical protein